MHCINAAVDNRGKPSIGCKTCHLIHWVKRILLTGICKMKGFLGNDHGGMFKITAKRKGIMCTNQCKVSSIVANVIFQNEQCML